MPGLGQESIERLRAFLRDLAPGVRAMLVARLERSLLRGDDLPGGEFILTELRRSLREGATNRVRIGDPARLFFQPIEPFLVDDASDHHHPGRISRVAIEPVWRWLGNSVMPDETAAYCSAVDEALLTGDADQVEFLTRAYQDRAVYCIRQALEAVDGDEKAIRRLAVQLGVSRPVEEARAIADIINLRDALASLGGQLPGIIRKFSGAQVESVKALFDSPLGAGSEFIYLLTLVMSRLAAPWQLIRLATSAAGTDAGKRIAEGPYASAVQIALSEVDRMTRELAGDLKSGRGIAVSALLKDVHDAMRGFRTELDLLPDSPWGRQLATLRGQISKILTAEIELVPGRVRRLVRPRTSKEIDQAAAIDPEDVNETDALIGFVMACRSYASEIALNEVTQRVITELQQCLDTGTRLLLDGMRAATGREREFRQAQVDAAVRFCSRLFGHEYAVLLAKAVDVAAQGERKLAKA